MRRAAKRDMNEAEIVAALREAGHLVVQLDKFDLLVQRQDGRVVMLEVKNDRGRVTDSQREMMDAGWRLHIVRNPEEALTVVESES